MLILEECKITSFGGNYRQYRQWMEQRKAPEANREMEELTPRMRLTGIIARLSAPSKGDSMEELDGQFKEISRKLRKLRG